MAGTDPRTENCRLFVAEGFDGVEARGLPGRIEPEEDADRGGETECEQDGRGREDDRPLLLPGQEAGSPDSQPDPDRAAPDRERERFDQELPQDVPPLGAT